MASQYVCRQYLNNSQHAHAQRDSQSLMKRLNQLLYVVAVCCSVLQCVAVCCSVLQCVAVCCSNQLLYTATYCDALQHIGTHCNTLQHTAIHLITVESMHNVTHNLSHTHRYRDGSDVLSKCSRLTGLIPLRCA